MRNIFIKETMCALNIHELKYKKENQIENQNEYQIEHQNDYNLSNFVVFLFLLFLLIQFLIKFDLIIYVLKQCELKDKNKKFKEIPLKTILIEDIF
jgi:hypothetical protein